MGRLVLRLVLSAIMSIVIFAVGFLLGAQLFQSKISQLQATQDELQVDTISLEIESQLLSESPCSSASLVELAKRMEQLGPKIDFLEKQSRTEELVNLKKYYSLLEIKHWLAIRNTNKNCNADFVPILYFYSNSECDGCAEQGVALLHQKTINPKLMIYSFDVDLDLSAVKILKTENKIAAVPTVVIAGKKYEGLQDANRLTAVLQQRVPPAVAPDNATES